MSAASGSRGSARCQLLASRCGLVAASSGAADLGAAGLPTSSLHPAAYQPACRPTRPPTHPPACPLPCRYLSVEQRSTFAELRSDTVEAACSLVPGDSDEVSDEKWVGFG